jgi:hypothetical protein
MDDALVPDEFVEHVHRYRFGRATAIVDCHGNPEAEGLASVRAWLQAVHTADGSGAEYSASGGGLGNRSSTFYAQLRTTLLREGLGICDRSNQEGALDPQTRDIRAAVRRVVDDVDGVHEVKV